MKVKKSNKKLLSCLFELAFLYEGNQSGPQDSKLTNLCRRWIEAKQRMHNWFVFVHCVLSEYTLFHVEHSANIDYKPYNMLALFKR